MVQTYVESVDAMPFGEMLIGGKPPWMIVCGMLWGKNGLRNNWIIPALIWKGLRASSLVRKSSV